MSRIVHGSPVAPQINCQAAVGVDHIATYRIPLDKRVRIANRNAGARISCNHVSSRRCPDRVVGPGPNFDSHPVIVRDDVVRHGAGRTLQQNTPTFIAGNRAVGNRVREADIAISPESTGVGCGISADGTVVDRNAITLNSTAGAKITSRRVSADCAVREGDISADDSSPTAVKAGEGVFAHITFCDGCAAICSNSPTKTVRRVVGYVATGHGQRVPGIDAAAGTKLGRVSTDGAADERDVRRCIDTAA